MLVKGEAALVFSTERELAVETRKMESIAGSMLVFTVGVGWKCRY